ncbi:phosphotransferase family protein [Nonomuraea diastatica]|uniref:Aminoglycoside phosphotransferase family protein n=1 Tax=Nonomuraea diastatica TaxID=1848329 RepID=A0A4R4WMP5_9ACTN|nr:aminoglycoside phosphotransferase family protein [Nonomuraea diastatica]TDD17055.1 aminoglycoside phosphotransferase family protein [Nonomuraea diastatica]
MPSDLVEMALREFHVVAERRKEGGESRSGAAVCAVRTAHGDAAYLKATPAALGAQALVAARRELRFYQNLAPVVPVHTPRLLDRLDTEQGVAVLLTAAGRPQGSASWTPDMWAGLGEDLAALHCMPLPTVDGWNRPDALLDALDSPNLPEVSAFWADRLPQLGDLLTRRAELREEIAAPSPAFIHGDCHTDNIMPSARALIFCDWQSTGVGRPVSDLAFLSVRATPSGTVVPRRFMDSYLHHRPRDRRVLERALVAEELAVLVFLWPPYASFNNTEGIARIQVRTRELADRYLGGAR